MWNVKLELSNCNSQGVLVQGRSSWWIVSFSQSHREWHGLKCWKFTSCCLCTTFFFFHFNARVSCCWLFEKISEFLSSPCGQAGGCGTSQGLPWGVCGLCCQSNSSCHCLLNLLLHLDSIVVTGVAPKARLAYLWKVKAFTMCIFKLLGSNNET